ncbi:MAG: Eco29kI family restriction endonuclease [Coriobacteriia bacterium]|nr:Eco29kI family restriction endonuclease [Coriobacteriia bacterium]
MNKRPANHATLRALLKQVETLRQSLDALKGSNEGARPPGALSRRFVAEAGSLIGELQHARELISPIHFGAIGITLGRSDSIAKFFAFSFTNQDKRPLRTLADTPFFGSGVYAIYYHGKNEVAYRPLSGSETPIYVGKADPKNPQAETVEEQGQSLYLRLKEHSKSIARADLPLTDFHYRAAPIQTGMQSAVEDFMIRLFRPIWNKEVKICFGIGKHGDSATTRRNKRSPWDTMHPGRKWAAGTESDQLSRKQIEERIADHFVKHPVIPDRDHLFKLLSLE